MESEKKKVCHDLSLITWWLHVTVKPESNKIRVLSRGIFKGFNTLIPSGGHTEPKTTLGERLAWKKAQKKEKNNISSDIIKRITPSLNPCCTFLVW